MGNELLAYFERLELMTFFTGYPLIYALVQVLAGNGAKKGNYFLNKLIALRPLAYALSGTLFLGLILKDLYPDYSFKNIADQFHLPFLKIWGVLSLLFWLPVFNKKPFYSLLHSLVFFFFLARDLYMHIVSSAGKEIIKNDMNIYTNSLLLNAGTLAFVVIVCLLLKRIRSPKKTR